MEKLTKLNPSPSMSEALKMAIATMEQRDRLVVDWLWDVAHIPASSTGAEEGWKEIRDAILRCWPENSNIEDMVDLAKVLINLAYYFNGEVYQYDSERRLWPVSALDAIQEHPEELQYYGWSYRQQDDQHAKLVRERRGSKE